MKFYNTLTKKKEEFIPLEVCLWADGLQLYPYSQCASDDRF